MTDEMTQIVTELDTLLRSMDRHARSQKEIDALVEFGDRLHRLGGVKAKAEAMEALCVMDPENAYWREEVVERRWF